MSLELVIGIATLIWLAALTVSVNHRYKTQKRRLRRLMPRAEFSERLIREAYGRLAELELRRDGHEPRFPIEFKAQHNEDVFLYELLGGQREGFFVEAGAFDGYFVSNTYAFEALGWTGLLVEAIESRARDAASLRTRSRVAAKALGGPGHPEFIEFGVNNTDRNGGQLTSRPVGLAAPGATSDNTDELTRVRVPVATLDEELAFHDGSIDAVFLDIEGTELEALRGLDLENRRPRVMIIEDHTYKHGSELGAYLHERGYDTTGWICYNRVMVDTAEPDLVARARDLLTHADSAQGFRVIPPENRTEASIEIRSATVTTGAP